MKQLLRAKALASFLLAAFLLCASLLSTNAARAESTGTQADRSVFYGVVTAVNGNAVTVAIGTLEMPQMPQQDGQGSGNSAQGAAPGAGDAPQGTAPADGSAPQDMPGGRGGSIADQLTMTGESVVIYITDSITLTKQSTKMPDGQTFDKGQNQGSRPEGSPDPNAANGTGQSGRNGMQGGGMGFGFGGASETAALSDIMVNSVVVLTYQTSTQSLLSVHILSNSNRTNP